MPARGMAYAGAHAGAAAARIDFMGKCVNALYGAE
jgi:hypothetical protein